MLLQDRVCVVTGASSGIGAAVARRFAAEGARVALGARSTDALEGVAKACGGGALAQKLDVRDPASVSTFAHAVRDRFGRCDVLVSNAGVGPWGPLESLTVEQWDDAMGVNLRGAFLVAKAFLPLLLAERPYLRTVLHTGSVAGHNGEAGGAAYCASKAGLRIFSQSLAAELAPKGVRVVCVNPGYVATPMVEDAPYAADTMIQPDEVAEVYLRLATLPDGVHVDEVNLWPRKLYTE